MDCDVSGTGEEEVLEETGRSVRCSVSVRAGLGRRAVSLTLDGGSDVRHTIWIVATVLFSLAACGGVTSPDGGGGGPVGQVTVGDIFFRSARNGTQNPAVDTIVAGTSVTWTWNGGSHSIQSTGLPPEVFRNSVVLVGANSTYSVTLRNPGTYPYQCAVHGSAMTGTIVVQ